MIELVAFDADDTLWHNEDLYAQTQANFARLLTRYGTPEESLQRLDATELRNLPYFGYGIKSFMLSMVETAVAVSGGQVSGEEIQQVLDLGKTMLSATVRLMDEAELTVTKLAETYPLMIITKGDLHDQEAKIARSGLAGYFKYIEIVSDKTIASYAALLAKYRVAASRFVMIGNSLRSDILPVAELGGTAVYIPYHLTWAHEVVSATSTGPQRYFELEHLGQLPELIERLNQPTV